ncbi:MAG: UDP-N-acetylmuramate--L-alanine ligase [Patescibacteria group bacterium]
MNLHEANNIHFIGIGGVGISALARLMLFEGKKVSGTNDNESKETLDGLREQGVEISLDTDPENLPKADVYIYSDAWLTLNQKILEEAKKIGPTFSYFEALGEFANDYELIAVSGTHGKTTTAAMLIDVFEEAGLDPMGIVGSLRGKTKSNFRAGKGKYFIVEADEYLRHFLNFHPKHLIITNIEEDHLDYYKDLADIQNAFNELAKRVPEDGFIICDPNNGNVKKVLEGISGKIIDYTKFLDTHLNLKVPGEHNRKNASAVFGLARSLGANLEEIKNGLENFSGTWRRFEYKGKTKSGALVYDDYAHHPSEIRATLQATREKFPDKKIILVFQPHLYSRTKLLFDNFAEALLEADRVLLAPIYAAREAFDPSISHEMLAREIRKKNGNAEAKENFEGIRQELENTPPNTVIITMGAGNIYEIGESLATEENKE